MIRGVLFLQSSRAIATSAGATNPIRTLSGWIETTSIVMPYFGMKIFCPTCLERTSKQTSLPLPAQSATALPCAGCLWRPPHKRRPLFSVPILCLPQLVHPVKGFG